MAKGSDLNEKGDQIFGAMVEPGTKSFCQLLFSRRYVSRPQSRPRRPVIQPVNKTYRIWYGAETILHYPQTRVTCQK